MEVRERIGQGERGQGDKRSGTGEVKDRRCQGDERSGKWEVREWGGQRHGRSGRGEVRGDIREIGG